VYYYTDTPEGNMLNALRVDPSDATPIWRQIEAGVRRLVATGAIPAREAIPSVRELARTLRVNPATVAKAYQRLNDAGVLTVRRGEGTFVSADPPALPGEERERLVSESAERYVSVVRTVGAGREEAADGAAAAWDRLFDTKSSGDGS
jgi:GntR family transcriptional regulator